MAERRRKNRLPLCDAKIVTHISYPPPDPWAEARKHGVDFSKTGHGDLDYQAFTDQEAREVAEADQEAAARREQEKSGD